MGECGNDVGVCGNLLRRVSFPGSPSFLGVPSFPGGSVIPAYAGICGGDGRVAGSPGGGEEHGVEEALFFAAAGVEGGEGVG